MSVPKPSTLANLISPIKYLKMRAEMTVTNGLLVLLDKVPCINVRGGCDDEISSDFESKTLRKALTRANHNQDHAWAVVLRRDPLHRNPLGWAAPPSQG